MLKVHIASEISLDIDDVLKSASNLELDELEELADKIVALRAQRRAPSLPQAEADLLQKINQVVPESVRKQYDELTQKLLDEIITPSEHEEYLALIDQVTASDAERLRHLVELAALRNVSLDALMEQLGLKQPTYA